jgi:acetoacetyl-[acyl-carrier protein] synthase
MDDDLTITDEDISVSGFTNKIVLPAKNPFADMV